MSHEVKSRKISVSTENVDKMFSTILEANHLNELALAQLVSGKDYLIIKTIALMTTNCYFTIFCAIETGKDESLEIEYKQLQNCLDEMKRIVDFSIESYKKEKNKNEH